MLHGWEMTTVSGMKDKDGSITFNRGRLRNLKKREHWHSPGMKNENQQPMGPQEVLCPNETCLVSGQIGQGNISVQSKKGTALHMQCLP